MFPSVGSEGKFWLPSKGCRVLGRGRRVFNTGSGSRAPFSSPPFDYNITGTWGPARVFSFDSSKMGNSQLSPFVPSFDGKASSFLDYEQRVTLWVRSTDVPVERQSTLLILHMDPTARQVCMYNSGGDTSTA